MQTQRITFPQRAVSWITIFTLLLSLGFLPTTYVIANGGATLTVMKIVEGGDAVAANFTMTVTGTDPSPASFPGSGSGTIVTLGEGAFEVSETGPDGYEASYVGYCSGFLESGDELGCTVTNTFVPSPEPEESSIHAYKFADLNGNGEQEEGELSISGWEICLYEVFFFGEEEGEEGLDLVSCELTDEEGWVWWMDDLEEGEYEVVEEERDGWVNTTLNNPEFVGLEDDGDVVEVRFGNQPLAVHAFKFNDIDADGEYESEDGEMPIEGWEICLYEVFFFGEEEGEEGLDLVSCELTDEDGWVWWMDDLSEGDYEIVEEEKDGWENTTENNPEFVGLEGGDEPVEVVFGNTFTLNSVHAYKFADLNGNGEQDEGELSISGWEICLYEVFFFGEEEGEEGLDLVSCELTDEDGWVWWMDLSDGDYIVEEEVPEGWENTTENNPELVGVFGGESIEVVFGNNIIAPQSGPSSLQSGPAPVSDLTITKSVSPEFANPGDTVAYSIALTNSGTATTMNIVVTDILPPGLEGEETSTRTWTVASLDTGESYGFTYSVTVSTDAGAGLYTNTVTATSTNDTPKSATATLEIQIRESEVLGQEALPHIVVEVTVDPPSANPGETITYTIVVKNDGEAVAQNVVITFTLPDGFSSDGGGAALGEGYVSSLLASLLAVREALAVSHNLTFTIGDLLPGETWSTTVSASIGAGVLPGMYAYTVSVDTDNHENVVSAAEYDVREGEVLGGEVLGFETLPETGGYPMWLLALASVIALLLYTITVQTLTRLRRVDWTVHRID